MSGGIDSAAALLMLKEEGYSVTAVYLMMHSTTLDDKTKQQLEELTHYTGLEVQCLDVSTLFRSQVVCTYLEACTKGIMLSPCTICNPLVKWNSLVEYANSIGAEFVATGHYCNITQNADNLHYITRGADPLKDQSYYMWRLKQSTLARIKFPLGSLTKKEVRDYMSKKGWETITKKKESMGVCFFGGLSFASWLETEGIKPKEGKVLDSENNIIGQHKGYYYYTLAQKKGFTLTDSNLRGLSVISISSENNTLTLGDAKTLTTRRLEIRDTVFASENELLNSNNISLMVRGVGFNPSGYVSVSKGVESGSYIIDILSDEAWAVTLGQPTVFYIEDRLLGGGTVTKVY